MAQFNFNKNSGVKWKSNAPRVFNGRNGQSKISRATIEANPKLPIYGDIIRTFAENYSDFAAAPSVVQRKDKNGNTIGIANKGIKGLDSNGKIVLHDVPSKEAKK